jgi:tetratricopeptide (TPR) repeat protein
MRNWNKIVKAFLGGAAALTLVACEEVDPPKPKPMVTHVQPVEAPKPAPVVVPPVETKVEVKPVSPEPVELGDLGKLGDKELLAAARQATDEGQLARAVKIGQAATAKMPKRSAAWNVLGRAQLKSGMRKEAIASFEKATEMNPQSSFAQNNLGLALIYDGQFEDAVDALEEATELEPVEGYMWNNLGMAYEHLDRLEEARDAYRKAATLEHPLAKQNLARLEGVKTIRTAKVDTVGSDVIPKQGSAEEKKVEKAVDLTEDLDGGNH